MAGNNIKSDLSLANAKGSTLTGTGASLGLESVEKVQDTNLGGVLDNGAEFDECMATLKTYQAQLSTDANHIRDLGLQFYNLDLNLARKM